MLPGRCRSHVVLPCQAFGVLRGRRHGVHGRRRSGRKARLHPGARQGIGQVRQRPHRHQRPVRHAAGRHPPGPGLRHLPRGHPAQEVALRCNNLLGGIGGITCPVVRPGNLSAWAQYSVLCPKREAVLDALKEARVPTAIYYPKPLHVQGAYLPGVRRR